MKVPLLDLKAQYAVIQKDAEEAMLRVAASQYFILGKEVEKLENTIKEYIGTKYATGVSSGTDALLLALMAIGIKPGDEIILPTYSFFATAGVVARLNAIPVFTDVEPLTLNMNPDDIERKITPKTKAIIPVHLYGQSADMERIMDIAKRHNLKVVEDGAQAIGVQYKDGRKVGSIGDIGCFSFFPSKNLGCFGDGGVVTTNDDELGERIRIMRVHGGKPKYFHKVIGGNFRLDEIQAAVLNVKFPYLQGWSAKRRENAKLYSKLFIEKGLTLDINCTKIDARNKVVLPKAIYEASGHTNYHIYNQYIILADRRDEVKKYLQENEIGCEIYYPVPFHKQECFEYLNVDKTQFPVSDYAAENSLALPIYPELTTDQITFVVDKIAEFLA
ncbi:MAG TPA: DegT/DnrJ/EryC1/StrS family aminotransferase [Ignavibacteria bacterium]|nr:DegT/DnrJ/EryC1/StrS family aminotransferase [Ignavibacteria bacterium]